MPKAPDPQQPDKTTANTPVSATDPGGTHPSPSAGKPVPRPKVESGDENRAPARNTDR